MDVRLLSFRNCQTLRDKKGQVIYITANDPHTPAAPRGRCVLALPGQCDHLRTCGKSHLLAIPRTNCRSVGGHSTRVSGVFIQTHLQRHSGGWREPIRVIWKVTFLGDSLTLHKWGAGAHEDSLPRSSWKRNPGVPASSWGFSLPSGFFMYKHLMC